MKDEKEIKLKKSFKNLTDSVKYNILKDYISLVLSSIELCTKYSISEKDLENYIRTLYRKFQNARETKTLIATQRTPQLSSKLIEEHVRSEHINGLFLNLVSEPDEPLTNQEILYSEFLIEYGDEVLAVEKSGLGIGLKKKDGKGHDIVEYREALTLRSFYLKRKPNVSQYITAQRAKNLTVIENGKEYIQEKMITLVDQMANQNNQKNIPSQLKALELIGRTVGAFDDKLILEGGNGDDALDAILLKAKKVAEDKKAPMIAYSSEDGGVEVYEN